MIVTVYRYGNIENTGYWFSFMRNKRNELWYNHINTEDYEIGGTHLYEYQINLINPLIFNPHTCFQPMFPSILYKHYIDRKTFEIQEYYPKRKESERALAKVLRLMDYDSVIFQNPYCYYEDTNGKDIVGDNYYIDLWLLRNIHTYRYYAREI